LAEAGEVAMEQETASAIPALVTSSLLCIIRNLPPLRPTCGEPAPRRQRPEPPAVRRAATDATGIGGGGAWTAGQGFWRGSESETPERLAG